MLPCTVNSGVEGGGEGARPLALSHPLPKRNPFLPHPKYSSTACVIGVAYHTGTCRTVKKDSLERLQDLYCTVDSKIEEKEKPCKTNLKEKKRMSK